MAFEAFRNVSDFSTDSEFPVGGEFVEVTLKVDCHENSVLARGARETSTARSPSGKKHSLGALLGWGVSTTSRIRHKFSRLKSNSSIASSDHEEPPTMSARDARRLRAKFQRTRSTAGEALQGLRFISKTTGSPSSREELWRNVDRRFDALAREGLLAREDFGECIGMESKEFAVCIFDALARRRRRKIVRITKDELGEFWHQISDQSFDARLQIFFDMADSNADGRITREEVQELITVSASANNLSHLKEQADEYASLIMEELDPENLGYIEMWQLESLLLQKDAYMSYSRTLSTTSAGWSQNIGSFRSGNLIPAVVAAARCFLLDNWQRGWIVSLWIALMCSVFIWKFNEYEKKAAFHVMGYCLATAKGAAETLKLNMALVLLPVCRNTLTWLRSTRARHFVPFDDNINFHKMIAFAIGVGILLHAGNHLGCDFPRLISSSPEQFSYIASDFGYRRPTLKSLVISVEGITGILMVILMGISFTLASHHFRRNVVRLPPPLNRLTGFNAFWYSHHLLGVVYILMLIHGSFLFLVHGWSHKTTWAYICIPFSLYVAERTIRTCRSGHYLVNTVKVSVLPGNVLTLILSKPNGFRYKSGQYVFLQCPKISPFEWHPFSITSAPSDDYLSVHIRTAGDWTRELRTVFTQSPSAHNQIGLPKLTTDILPRLLVDGPYGGAAQDYQNYDVLLLVGLGIGATPFISILRDLLNDTKSGEEQDSSTETSRSDDSVSSSTSSAGKKKVKRMTRAYFYWVTRETGSFEWFKGIMNEVAEMDHKGLIELHNYLTSVYEEGDARSTLLTMVQALKHAKDGVDILSGTRVRTHFARPSWKEVFARLAAKHPRATVGVFYCGMPTLAKELKKLSLDLSNRTATRFEFHKEYF